METHTLGMAYFEVPTHYLMLPVQLKYIYQAHQPFAPPKKFPQVALLLKHVLCLTIYLLLRRVILLSPHFLQGLCQSSYQTSNLYVKKQLHLPEELHQTIKQ